MSSWTHHSLLFTDRMTWSREMHAGQKHYLPIPQGTSTMSGAIQRSCWGAVSCTFASFTSWAYSPVSMLPCSLYIARHPTYNTQPAPSPVNSSLQTSNSKVTRMAVKSPSSSFCSPTDHIRGVVKRWSSKVYDGGVSAMECDYANHQWKQRIV